MSFLCHQSVAYFKSFTGVTPAERLLSLYETKWQRNVDHVFEHLLYWWFWIELVDVLWYTISSWFISTPGAASLSSGPTWLLVDEGNCHLTRRCGWITSLGPLCFDFTPDLQGEVTTFCTGTFVLRLNARMKNNKPILCTMATVCFFQIFVGMLVPGFTTC